VTPNGLEAWGPRLEIKGPGVEKFGDRERGRRRDGETERQGE
jgi:hypothetical protein